jgi:SPP1 family predicted phage head-tail adaptor
MARRLPQEINAGELRHRIKIVQPTGVQDAMGGVSQDPSQWTPVRECWASIEAWNGSSQLATEQFVSTSSHWIVIRHPRGTVLITAKMLVWFNKRTFQIDAVLNPTEQTKLLVLVCTEVNSSSQEAPTPVAT